MIKFLKSLFSVKPATQVYSFSIKLPTEDFFGVERPKQKVEVNRKPLVKKASGVAQKTKVRKVVKK